MNEEALNDAYALFKGAGYNKSIEDFKQLLKTNNEALQDAHKLFVDNGYNKSVDDFASLIGVIDTQKKNLVDGTSPMEPMGSTLPQEGTSGLSESEELLGETEPKTKDPVDLIIDGFSVDTDSLTDEELAPYKVDDDLRERSAILGSESVFFNKASNEVAKSRYIQDQLKQKAETLDGYYRDKIKSDLSKDLEFRRINNEIESKYGNLINSKRNELRRKVFNGEISRGESKDVLLKLIDEAEVRIAKEKSENDYLNQKYMEAINQYKDEWQGSRDRLSDKAEEIVNDIDANSFFKPLRNAVLQVYKTSMASAGAGLDVVSDIYNNLNPKYKELEYQTTLELSELAGIDVPEGLKGKKREDLTLKEVKDLINLKSEVKEVLGKSTYNNLLKDKEREFFRNNPGERSAIQNLAADFMDSAQAFEDMSDSIGLTTRLSDINSVGDFGDWAWNTISQLGSQVAMSGLTGGGYLYAQGIADTYYDSLMELAEDHKESTGEDLTMQEILDLSDGRMVTSSMVGGIVMGVLEKYGLDNLLKGNGIALKAIVEAGTESLQEIVQAVATDVGTDKKLKDISDRFKSSEFWGQVGEASVAGAFGGGFVGGLSRLRKRRGDEELKLSTITANEDLKNKVMKSEVASGKYKLGDAFVTRTDINDAIENAKTPEDLNNIEVTDDKGIQDKLESKLNQLRNAVQEQETREVPDAEQAEGVQEVEGEVRESDIEEARPIEEASKVSEALGSTVFIDNKKGTLKIDDTEGAGKKVIFESEDGTQIRDIGDIDVIGNSPIGDFNLRQEVRTTQEQTPTRAEGETVINTEGDVVTSPVGVQEGGQRPATFLRERKDGSIVVRDERGLQRSIKGDQARQFKMRFPNVKKGDGVRFQLSDTTIEDGNSIDQKTTSEVSISDTKRTSELKERQSDQKKKDVISFAEKAINTLKSVLPNFEIYIHDSVDSYNSFVDSIGAPRASRGNFAYRTNENGNIEGRIDINLSTANIATVAHEVTHGIFLATLDGSPKLYEDFRRKVSSVISDSTNKKLNDFANKYIDNDGNLLDVTHEEYLAELTSLLSQEGKSLPISTLEKIAKIINQIVSKATKGKLKPFQRTANKNDVLEYFNSISKSLSSGSSFDFVTDKINSEAPSTGTKQQLPDKQKDNVSKDFEVFTTKNNISLTKGLKGVARNIGSLRSLRLKDAKIPFKKDPVNLVIGNPDVGISIGELMTYYKRSLFSAKKFFSKDLFKGKELKEAKIVKNLNIVEQNVAKLNRSIRKNKLDSEEQIQQLDLFLRGLPNTLNEKIIPIATEMRQHIDSLSQILIDNGWVADTKEYVVEKVSKDKGEYFVIDTGTGSRIKLSPAQVKQIEVDGKAPAEGETVTISSAVKNNLGNYLTRSYKIFDDANWKDKVEDVIVQRAKNLYRQQLRPVAERLQLKNAKEQIRERLLPQYTNDDGTVNELELNKQVENEYSDMDGQQIGNEIESILEQMVDNKIDEVLKSDDVKGFLKKGKLGSKDLSILKERKDIPLEIRMLMGEYTDPIQNYARTILKQSSLVANQRFLESAKKMGMGNFFFEADQPRPRGFDFQIAAEGSETMAPLNGLYTTKEIYEQFQDASDSLPVYFEIYMKAISGVKWAKTIGSVTTHLKNFFGNLAFMAANGHWRVGEMNKAFAIIKNDISSKSNEELNQMMNEYIDLTIVKQSAGLNEIRDMFKDANFDEAMYKRLSKQPTHMGKAKRLGLKAKKFLEDVYGGTDDLFKIVAYENEMSRYSQALYGKDKSNLTEAERGELSSYVAEIVKNTYPTYSRVPEAIQLIRRFPLLGNFVSFQAESWRTAYNTLNIAKNEMKSDNPKVRKIGMERIIGITSYLAIKDTLISYFSVQAGMGLSGIIGSLIDDDEEKEKQNALKKYVAPWNKNSEKIILEAKEGEIKYIDVSSSDPYGGIAQVFNAIASGDDLEEKVVEGFLASIEPFTGVDITTNTLSQIIYNDNGYGGRIYNPEDPNKLSKKLIYAIKKLEPGTISSMRRLGDAENLTQEITAQLLGLRTYDNNLSDSFGFKFIGKDGYRERLRNAKSLFNQKYDKDATLEEIVEGKKVSDNAVQDVYIDIYDDLSAAVRLGAPVPELIKKMKSLGLSNKDIKIVLLAGNMKGDD